MWTTHSTKSWGPIRVEHWGHVTRCPPITAHLGTGLGLPHQEQPLAVSRGAEDGLGLLPRYPPVEPVLLGQAVRRGAPRRHGHRGRGVRHVAHVTVAGVISFHVEEFISRSYHEAIVAHIKITLASRHLHTNIYLKTYKKVQEKEDKILVKSLLITVSSQMMGRV